MVREKRLKSKSNNLQKKKAVCMYLQLYQSVHLCVYVHMCVYADILSPRREDRKKNEDLASINFPTF
jgi:hypothetical protein